MVASRDMSAPTPESEVELDDELDDARIGGLGCDLAERRAVDVVVADEEVHSVEDVEQVDAQLQRGRAPDPQPLGERQIDDELRRTIEAQDVEVAHFPGHRV